jgi:indolepyruvate ferredoxin oxidoreductase
MMLGFAWQKGWIPLGRESLLRAIELNAVAVDNNKAAFEWGRRAAHDWASVEKLLAPAQVLQFRKRETLEDMVALRVEFLTAYQDAAYAQRYRAFVEKVRQREAPLGKTLLSESVARYLFKLMAYKDEYEVARLHTDGSFLARVDAMFEGDFKLNYHMAPPLVSRRNDKGELQKQKFGPAMLTAFRVLARLKGLRGTVWDIFGKTEERRGERALITDYMASIDEVLATLDASNLAAAVEIARIPEQIRGYGHVKARHLVAARASWQEAMARWRAPDGASRQQVLQTLGVGRA